MTAKYCRENKVPYFGICLGMQIQTIEFARHIFKDERYTSEEFDEQNKLTPDFYVIHFLPGQYKERDKLYGEDTIEERHRHRYEYNTDLRKNLEKAGLITSGIFPKGNLVEMVEMKNHPYMVGCQFHPEFLSRPNKPHPLFKGLIAASIKNSK